MLIEKAILSAIVDAVISHVTQQSVGRLEACVRNTLGVDATKKAFQEALGEAFAGLSKQHAEWVADNFDASFFQHEGAPTLAQFLLRDGHPDPGELAARWADSLNIQHPERRAFYTRELEPIAADFLDDLAHYLKSKAELRELHDSRAFEQASDALQALRHKLGAEKATFGTRRDYLCWLIDRNLYLDPRGTFQTQRQVQLKLDEVYISLRAQRDETPGTADHHLFEKELASVETATAQLAAEEREDRREHLQARFENRLTMSKAGEILELGEAVTRYDRVVILGDPGSGKTTLLRYLALKHADALWHGRTEAGADLGVARFPILIRIAEYAEDGTWKKKSLSDFLADCYTLHDCPKNGLADLLQTELEKGHCLVLLDGLDEIVSADERLGVVKQIEDFVRHHASKANHFVVTSRKAGYRSAPLAEPFTHYTVQEMNETQIRCFLECWCQAVEDAQTPELSIQERKSVAKREIDGIMKAVQKSPGVRRLAANPLLLRVLALIHRTGARLPQKRIELYKIAADTLARTWRTAQGVPESALVKDEYLTPLLSRLAYWLHVHKPTGLATEREVYKVLGETWAHQHDMCWDADNPSPKIQEEVRKFLLAVREHTGLFVERAPKRYGFMHLTFEEYYVARHLVARSKTRAKLIRQHLHQPRWEEPILLALGFVGLESTEDSAELVETAILAEGEEAQELGFTPSQHEDLLGRDYLFALRCLGDNIPVRARVLKRLIERLADELLHDTGLARFPRYGQALIERLRYLGGSEGASVLLPLLITALDDPNKDVRYYAAQSLGQLGQASAEVISALLTALHDPSEHVRSRAAYSLGRASAEVLSALLTALYDPSENVRSCAAESLGRLSQASAEVISALLTALHDADADVRAKTAESLGRLSQASDEVLSALLTALHDADERVRSGAVWSLGQLGQTSSEVLAELGEALRQARKWSRRHYSARLLGQVGQGDDATLDALWHGLLDENNNVRRACAVALHSWADDFPRLPQSLRQSFLGQCRTQSLINPIMLGARHTTPLTRGCGRWWLGVRVRVRVSGHWGIETFRAHVLVCPTIGCEQRTGLARCRAQASSAPTMATVTPTACSMRATSGMLCVQDSDPARVVYHEMFTPLRIIVGALLACALHLAILEPCPHPGRDGGDRGHRRGDPFATVAPGELPCPRPSNQTNNIKKNDSANECGDDLANETIMHRGKRKV